MYEGIINNLRQSGWTLVALEGKWVCATHGSQKRGLLLGSFSELPQEFKPWTSGFTNIVKWEALVFCPEGLDSARLKQHRYPGIQVWYWDTQQGNLFPFPPTNDRQIPRWLKQLAGGKSEFLGVDDSQAEKHFAPLVTYAILAINLVVFLLMVIAGLSLFPSAISALTDQRVLIEFGAKVNSLIQAGEVWRLLTSTFIHVGILHLVFNLYALWAVGPLTEKIFGHVKFVLIYICSGLGGSLASFIFSPAVSAGASGAIFGLLGALLYYSYKRPSLWKSGLGMNLLIIILVNLGFGLSQSEIDNYAHLGGLLTGALTSLLIKNHFKIFDNIQS